MVSSVERGVARCQRVEKRTGMVVGVGPGPVGSPPRVPVAGGLT